eukprot:CAMPEP_0194148520 /NCGR_PEP_ID=MMETSP0152-20130528/32980_1 /TAXON_ID=1049557 /ORGANISM="Thalassiothrix antarctica, Strain L6-D1" /LENGTH=32 /DNA_ID= /DNA_START= /DNA_END= /DNA_ORIENTATION=
MTKEQLKQILLSSVETKLDFYKMDKNDLETCN